jgi:hypothetical protein
MRARIEAWLLANGHRIGRDDTVIAPAVARLLGITLKQLGDWRRKGLGPEPCETLCDQEGKPVYVDGAPWYSLDAIALDVLRAGRFTLPGHD